MSLYVNSPVTGTSAVVASFTGPATSIGVTGLDGDNDGNYKINFDLTVVLTGTRSFILKINGLSTNQSVLEVSANAGTVTFGSSSTLELMNAVSTTTHIWGWINLTSKTGATRKMTAFVYSDRTQENLTMGEWTVTTGNITQLDIVSPEANSISAASMTVVKLHEP